MKNLFFILVAASMLAACSSKTPPKPRGSAFPINSSVIQGE